MRAEASRKGPGGWYLYRRESKTTAEAFLAKQEALLLYVPKGQVEFFWNLWNVWFGFIDP